MIKRFLVFLILILVLPFSAVAEETNSEDFLKSQYENSGADRLNSYLPDETKDFFTKNGIDPLSEDLMEFTKPKNVFTHIINFLHTGAKAPLTAGAIILSITLISSAIGGMNISGAASVAAGYAVALTTAVAIITPVFSVINASANALKGCATFMTAFVPIFAVIVTAAGKGATSVSMSSLLLGACQVITFIADFCVIPLMSGYLAISITSGISPLVNNTGIAEGIKKICYWTMSLLTTVFLGILSIQTAVSASADTLSLKTVKFIIGSAVPVAGTALSEALTTVTASMGMLKTTVGIYGVIACALIFLPLLAELCMWRLTFNITTVISDLLSVPKISAILKTADTVLSILIGIILLSGAMFIISLSVVLASGKAQ